MTPAQEKVLDRLAVHAEVCADITTHIPVDASIGRALFKMGYVSRERYGVDKRRWTYRINHAGLTALEVNADSPAWQVEDNGED